MNGPDHYREAERLLKEVKETNLPMPNTIAAAQAHATLALAAASAAQAIGRAAYGVPSSEWKEVQS